MYWMLWPRPPFKVAICDLESCAAQMGVEQTPRFPTQVIPEIDTPLGESSTTPLLPAMSVFATQALRAPSIAMPPGSPG